MIVYNLIKHTHTDSMERRTCRCYAKLTPGDLVKGTHEGQSPYLSGDVPVKSVGFMPVRSTAARGPGTVCKGAQMRTRKARAEQRTGITAVGEQEQQPSQT